MKQLAIGFILALALCAQRQKGAPPSDYFSQESSLRGAAPERRTL
jgi:hypothetical protein